jgi:phage terminase large subunit
LSAPEIEFPEKLECLFQPARYKVLYGGRGGAKSWGIARALLIQGVQRPLRILCAREFQRSMKDSVHKLLSDQIAALRLGHHYAVFNDTIRGKNGTEFTFAGLHHNVDNIKSTEGCDVCWVEEAHTVSKGSWDKLVPTIRKDGSEIWVSFNPELETDETYKRFVISPPSNAIVVKVGLDDNPWVPSVLRQEADDLKAKSEDDWLHVYGGACKSALEGAIYAEELRALTREGRITRVPYDPSKPVHTFWDLGWSDCVSIWCAQSVGMEFRVIDFVQSRMRPASWYVAELQRRPYAWGIDWLPHDGKAQTMAAAALPEAERTIKGQLEALNRNVEMVPNVALEDGFNAARTVFPKCWFDEANCADGINALRRYRYKVDDETKQFSRLPLHDEHSHAADAFRYFALAMTTPREKRETRRPAYAAGAWMG